MKAKSIGDNFSVEVDTLGGKELHTSRLIELPITLDTESPQITMRLKVVNRLPSQKEFGPN